MAPGLLHSELWMPLQIQPIPTSVDAIVVETAT
jgi:hypothetical protein